MVTYGLNFIMTLHIIFFANGIPRNNDVTMVFAVNRITVLIRTFSGNALC